MIDLRRALCHLQIIKPQLAVADFKKVLELDPKNNLARSQMQTTQKMIRRVEFEKVRRAKAGIQWCSPCTFAGDRTGRANGGDGQMHGDHRRRQVASHRVPILTISTQLTFAAVLLGRWLRRRKYLRRPEAANVRRNRKIPHHAGIRDVHA